MVLLATVITLLGILQLAFHFGAADDQEWTFLP
jgi:hypothetical protein